MDYFQFAHLFSEGSCLHWASVMLSSVALASSRQTLFKTVIVISTASQKNTDLKTFETISRMTTTSPPRVFLAKSWAQNLF